MKNQFNIGRRKFAIGAAIGFGAVITGISGSKELLSQIHSFDNEKKAFSLSPNIWLEISKDNTIILTIPRSELGQGVRTSLSMILAEELDADWEKIQAVNAVGDKKYGNQSTGGSTSIRVFWDTLRIAGGQVRALMITAAAQIWGISESQCRTEKSYVFEINGTRSVAYGDLIERASEITLPEPDKIKLKEPSEFKIIGKTKWHIDNPDIVTGKAIYSSDFKYPDMKYAVALRMPETGSLLKSFDDSEAKKMNGFIGAYRINEGIGVVANSTYIAMQAAEKIKTDWNPGPNSTLNSEKISAAFREKIGKLPDLPEGTIKQIESVYEVPLLAHATMEPMNSFAHFKDNQCEVWTMTQNPQTARSTVAKVLDISEDNVTVNVLLSGGGFGRGHRNDFVGIAAQISKASGHPIKFYYTKEDDTKHDYYRPMSLHALKAGIDKTGNISGYIHKVISQGTVKATELQYDVPNVQNLDDAVNFSIPTGSWRAVNNTQLSFVNECMLDELAELAGADKVQFRLDITKEPRLRKVIETVAEKAEWNKKLPQNWGRGFASFVGYGGFAAHVIEVSVINGKIKVERVVAALDCGIAINPGNIVAQFMGSAIDGLSTALKSEITVKNGRIEQSGFHDFEWLTMRESPKKIEVHILESNESPGGIGELGFPSITPALCNAIHNACGVRVRKLPIKHTKLG